MRNGNFLKMRVSEIRVKQIRVNQGLGVLTHIESAKGCVKFLISNWTYTLSGVGALMKIACCHHLCTVIGCCKLLG